MLNSYVSFIDTYSIALLISILIALKLNISYFKNVQAFFYKATGFYCGFCKSTLLTLICTLLILLYSVRGIGSSVVFLITLRVLWVLEFAFSTLEQTE